MCKIGSVLEAFWVGRAVRLSFESHQPTKDMKSKINPRLLFANSLTALTFTLTSAIHAASGTWLGNTGNWDDTGHRNSGVIAEGIASTSNFTGVNITANQTVTLGVWQHIARIRRQSNHRQTHLFRRLGSRRQWCGSRAQ